MAEKLPFVGQQQFVHAIKLLAILQKLEDTLGITVSPNKIATYTIS
jgi:hypothetical protein